MYGVIFSRKPLSRHILQGAFELVLGFLRFKGRSILEFIGFDKFFFLV